MQLQSEDSSVLHMLLNPQLHPLTCLPGLLGILRSVSAIFVQHFAPEDSMVAEP